MDLKVLTVSFVFMAVAYFGAPTSAQAEPSSQTADFARTAAIGNTFEIESSELAINKASDKDVKNFARMIVADHTQIGDHLKQALASSDTGIFLTEKQKLDEGSQKTLDNLNTASAATFDNLYVQAQSKIHDEAVPLFADYAENGDNASLKKFAADTLPTLKKHQELVHTLTQSFMTTRE